MENASGQATILLRQMEEGDRSAAEDLLVLLYAELKGIAARAMNQERASHTLGPTALVHEAWMRLVPSQKTPSRIEGREHFVRIAAKAMRQVLVDHARARGAVKRGRNYQAVPLDDVLASFEERDLDLLALDDALGKMAEMDPELSRLVELRFFAGLTIDETASILDMGTATVERRWRVARMWLRRELQVEDDGA